MFDEVTKKEGGKRAARRGVWLLGSTALQTAFVLGIIAASTALAKKAVDDKLVDVKFVKQAAPTPPAPPPPPPAPKKRVAQQKPKTEAKPRPAMVQPKEMPQELKPPDPGPAEPEDEGSDDGVEGGVIGGVVGGTVGGTAAPPPPPPKKPVEFNATMTPPQAVAGPPLEYTQQALEHEVEGTMMVKCIVSIDGTVHDCRVLRSVPFMDKAVVGVLERRRYKPATQGGQPLDVEYTFTIRLKLPR